MSTSLCRIALVSTDWSEMLRNSRKDSLRPAGPPVLIRTEEAANLAKDLCASRLGGLLRRTNQNGTDLRGGFARSGLVVRCGKVLIFRGIDVTLQMFHPLTLIPGQL